MTLREGAARSSNAVAVALAERVGRDKVIRAARRLGITSQLRPDPSLALRMSGERVYWSDWALNPAPDADGAGADVAVVTRATPAGGRLLELTGAYAAVANGGTGVWPYGIEEIRDGGGRLLYRRSGDGPGRVVEPGVVAGLNDLFTAVVAWGTGKAAKLDRPAAGKTGTNQDNRDAWFVGYTPDMVAGVWLGNDNFAPMDSVSGGSLAARMWKLFMDEALRGVPPHPLARTAGDLSVR